MKNLIKEDLSVVKKIRFIIIAALAYVGAVVDIVMTKKTFLNDLVLFSTVEKYIFFLFNSVIGAALIISTYRVKYTKNNILSVEEKGLKRIAGVFSKFLSGAVILLCCYALLAILVLILGAILGAAFSAEETRMFLLLILFNWLAAFASYALSLFWLYLFAFPVFPVMVYIGFVFVSACFFRISDYYAFPEYKWSVLYSPKNNADIAFARAVFHNPGIEFFLILLMHILIPFLLSALVFKYKKIKTKKKNSRRKKNPPH